MIRYAAGRLLAFIPVLWGILTITFFVLRFVPGGPFDRERSLPPEVEANILAKYHLDEPLAKQYVRYMGDVLRGDLGPSYKYPDRRVIEIIGEGLPVSASLGLLALAIALGLAIPAGSLGALRQNSGWDTAVSLFTVFGLSISVIVLGPLMSLVFGLWLGWFPVAGFGSLSHLVMPALCLGLVMSAPMTRLCRAGILEVIRQDYVRAARARGVPQYILLVRHLLRGGLLPLIQYLGPASAAILTGTFVVEKVFWIPGLGKAFIQSVSNRDYTLLLGTVLVYGVLLLAMNLASDLGAALLDPRIRVKAKT